MTLVPQVKPILLVLHRGDWIIITRKKKHKHKICLFLLNQSKVCGENAYNLLCCLEQGDMTEHSLHCSDCMGWMCTSACLVNTHGYLLENHQVVLPFPPYLHLYAFLPCKLLAVVSQSSICSSHVLLLQMDRLWQKLTPEIH